MTSRESVYKRRQPKGENAFGSANAFEGALCSFFCSVSWKAGELSAIESGVTVIIRESISACVARSGSAVAVIASDLCLFVLLICIIAIVSVTCAS
ncbi:hypothetical protein AVEN_101453-1 [Araneus ventricosus]|uniref:Uncharacterized protein n=1 Tax=Araneus ventricosus TaxID=182803 RepID=A0A4Y2CV66_ARAVE|nr:hypothetical protein AVEN_101453-1 [Araneus ventricosus]